MSVANNGAVLAVTVGERLAVLGKTVCTAESCTGGLIASQLTDIPGSSRYLLGGIVAYSNTIKEALLGVQTQTLIDFGAVSEQTAGEMALGAIAQFGTDFALSVTGIAGPGGGTEEKPVGLTYIGLADASGVVAVNRFVWGADRIANKYASADAALRMMLDHLTP